jgi:MFS family permease
LKNLFAYFAAFLTGDAAAQIQSVAIAWSVYSVHHRAFDLGLVGLVLFAPSLVLMLLTGHVVDRYDRKRTVIVTAVLEGLLSLVFAALVFAHVQQLVLLLFVVLLLGIVRAFADPVESTILVMLVDPAEYLGVQARYSSLRELVVLAAPVAGGALVALSPFVALGVAGGMTFAAALLFASVRMPEHSVAEGSEGFSLDSALEGLRFIRSRPILLGAISLDLFAILFGGAATLLPIYADNVLHVGAFGFGVLRGAGALGASLMALALVWRSPARHVGRTLLLTVAGFGAAMLLFAFSRAFWLSILALAAAGAFDMISVVIRRGLVQLNTPNAMRGRVNAVNMVFIGASGQLGSFESGTVAQFFGAVPAVAFGGVATLVLVALWTLTFPDLRKSDRVLEQ